MKRLVICLLLLMLLLSACNREAAYTIELNDMTFAVDMDLWTITQGEDVYDLQYDQGESESTVTITYPNGATYYRTQQGSVITTGHSAEYDPERYVKGEVLVEVLEQPRPADEDSKVSPLLGVALILFGAFNLFLPEMAWNVQYGWVDKKAKPTNFAIFLNRVTGAIAAFLGVILTFF